MKFVLAVADHLLHNWKAAFKALCALLGLLYAAYSIRIWHRLRHFKGPFSSGFSRFWLVRNHANGRTYLELLDVCKKYGSIARIGPNELVTCDPDYLRRIWAVRSPYKRSNWYIGMQFSPGHDNILSTMDDDYHNVLRSKMAAGYAGKDNDHLEQTIDENVAALIKLIESKYISTSTDYRPMDFARKSQFFTLDVISSIAFGRSFGDLVSDSDNHTFVGALEEAGPAIMVVTVLPWISTLLQLPFLKGVMPSAEDKIGLGKVMGMAKEIVGERFGPDKKVQRDMLGSFVAHGLTQDEAENESVVQILAGSETTATAIRVIILFLITNPHILSKFLDEISATSPSSIITDSEAKKMPYLQAIIKEGLRIWPPITGLMSKAVPPGGDVVNGLFIPEGTQIGYCAWGVFRNKEIWGEDANEFRPERWIENSPERLKEMDDIWGLIFGYGKFACMGKTIAMIELNKVFVELLRRFEFTIIDPTKPWDSKCNGLFIQSQMWMRVRKREKML